MNTKLFIKFISGIFNHIEYLNDLSNFEWKIHKRAIDYAKGGNQNRKLINEKIKLKMKIFQESQRYQSTINSLENQLHQYAYLNEISNEVQNTLDQS